MLFGDRIGGVVSADLRMKGWGKVISIASKAWVFSVLLTLG
jgi:ribosomal protein L14